MPALPEKIHKESEHHSRFGGTYIHAAVFGANDGIVTTFAVVAGVAGASLPVNTVLIMGFANLLADGLAMGLGNYLGTKSEADYVKQERKIENWEIEHIPALEKKEIEEIYKKKGFEGKDLARVVAVVTGNKKIWAETMMAEELGLTTKAAGNAAKNGVATFIAFGIAGLAPLLPYLFHLGQPLSYSMLLTCAALFAVGSLRTLITKKFWLQSGLEMLLIGVIAAGAAYLTGSLITRLT